MHGAPHRPVQRARPEDCREEAERPCRTRPETKQPRARRLGHQRPHDVQVFLLSFHVVLAEGHHPLRGSAREAQARAEARAPQCAAVYFHSSKLACMVRLELRPQPLREAGMLLPCQRRELLDLGAAAAERPELEPPDAIARARRGHTLKETMVAAQRNLQESAPHSARHCPLFSPCGRPKAHNVMGSPKAHRTSLGVHVAHKIPCDFSHFFVNFVPASSWHRRMAVPSATVAALLVLNAAVLPLAGGASTRFANGG